MFYFINKNGQQQGPVPANTLTSYGVTAETMVWKQGMAQWAPAKTISELAAYFTPVPPRPQGYGAVPPPPQPAYPPAQPAYAPQQPTYTAPQQPAYTAPQPNYAPQQPLQKPATHRLRAIISGIFFCWPLGLMAAYYANECSKANKFDNYPKAVEYSEKARKWSNYAFIFGIIIFIIYFTTNFM